MDRRTIAPQTRVYLWLLVGVIACWGLPLYLYPQGAATYWAWQAANPRSAVLVGAIYFVSAIYYIRLAFEREWLQVRTCLKSLFVVAAWLLVVAMVEWRSFYPYRPETMLWLAAYYLPLFALPIIFRLQRERFTPDQTAGPRIARGWQNWLIVRGSVYAAAALLAFVYASDLTNMWPWPIEPVNVRMFSGQLALFGVFPAFAIEDGLWRRLRHFFAIGGLLGVAHLVGLWTTGGAYDSSSTIGLALPLVFAEWALTSGTLWLIYGR
jgi:hypothetical protein